MVFLTMSQEILLKWV